MSETGEFVFPINALGNVGLTKREYFAGIVIQGLLTRNNERNMSFDKAGRIVEESVIIADMLLEELVKENK